METLLAFVTGGLFAVSTYLLLRRHLLRIIFGLILLTNAVNLLLLTLGGLSRGTPPLIPETSAVPIGPMANPLPQALILTSIVISLGVLAFILLLVYRTEKAFDSTDVDTLREADGPGELTGG